MFDRFIQIINKCSSEKFNRGTVDEAVEFYFRKGAKEAERWLTDTKKFAVQDATQLVLSIEKENDHLNRQALMINSIFSFIMLVMLVLAIALEFYFNIVVFGLLSILWLIALRKSIVRYIRCKKNRYVPGMLAQPL